MVRLRSIHDDEAVEYEYDPESGAYTQFEISKPSGPGGARGFADVRDVGLRRKEKVFAGIYSLEDKLHVALPPQHFSWPGPFSVRRRSLLSRIKSFSIESQARMYVHFFYAFIDHVNEFPGPEAFDIFKMIAWKTGTLEETRRTILLWEGLSRGENLSGSEFQLRLRSAKLKA